MTDQPTPRTELCYCGDPTAKHRGHLQHQPTPQTEPICLTPEEEDALRQILAMLATIDERAFNEDSRLLEVTRDMWRDMLLRPAQRLRRITTRRITP